MKVRTDRALIASRQRLGSWTALGGLIILVGGLIVSFRWQTPVMIGATYIALIVGMLLSSVGIYLSDKWVQEPRADQSLETALKGFDDKYSLYNYVLPADHVLVSPHGVMVFAVKRHGDTVRYVNGKWKHQQNLLKRLQSLSRERLGDPIQQLGRDVARMEGLLGQEFPNADIPVSGAVVFTHPDVSLHIDGVPADVLHVKKLKSYIRRAIKREERISDELLGDLQEALDRH
ncbi:MAG: nuclease-related domain-containing protein [Anaerolineae bacterium]